MVGALASVLAKSKTWARWALDLSAGVAGAMLMAWFATSSRIQDVTQLDAPPVLTLLGATVFVAVVRLVFG